LLDTSLSMLEKSVFRPEIADVNRPLLDNGTATEALSRTARDNKATLENGMLDLAIVIIISSSCCNKLDVIVIH